MIKRIFSKKVFSYFVSYSYVTSRHNGNGMIEIRTTKKLKFKDLSKTIDVILPFLQEIVPEAVKNNIVILNIILMGKVKGDKNE